VSRGPYESTGRIRWGYANAGQRGPVAELDLPNLDLFVPAEPMQSHNRGDIYGCKVLIRLGLRSGPVFQPGGARASHSPTPCEGNPPVMRIIQQRHSGPMLRSQFVGWPDPREDMPLVPIRSPLWPFLGSGRLWIVLPHNVFLPQRDIIPFMAIGE